MPSEGQPKDPEDSQMIHLAKAWANANGGRIWLEALNKLALAKNNKTTEDKILFNASEEEFLKHGETKMEHLRWRQLELYILCERAAWHLTNSLNQHNQSHDHQEVDEDIYDIDESCTELLIEPQIEWNKLEAVVIDWYLKTKKKTSFEIPNFLETNSHKGYASVRYYEWEQTNGSIKTYISTVEEEKKSQEEGINVVTKEETKLTWDDLEDDVLTNKAASIKIQCWIEKDRNKISKTLAEIEKALKSPSRQASEQHNNGEGIPFPIQLTYSTDYHFEKLAMVKLGQKGRGNSARYRVIKQNK